MAEVFEAAHVDNPECVVAVKVLLPQYAADPDFVRMFEHEAKLLAHLSHPNLVQVHELGADGELLFLVMDYVDGMALSDLERWLRKHGRRFPAGVACTIAHSLLAALEVVHGAKADDGSPLGIVHRDVTPQNVLLSRAGGVQLGDFGIARSNIRDGRTRTGVIKGKLRFLAPEQVTGSSVDARTDLYAVGLLLFELLTAEPYIRGDSEIELLREAEAPPWRAPSSVADVDPRVDALLEKALRRFPEERYASARAFRRALERTIDQLGWRRDASALSGLIAEALEGEKTDAKTAPVPETLAINPKPRRASFRPEIVASVLAVVGVGAVLLTRGGEDPTGVNSSAPAPCATPALPAVSQRPAAPIPISQSIATQPGSAPRTPSGRQAAAQAWSRATASAGDLPGPSRSASASAEPDAARLASLKQQIDGLGASLTKRGVLISDLSSSDRAALRAANEDVQNGRVSDAETALAALAPRLGAIQVDADFVKRKLDRTNAAIRNAEQRGQSTVKLRELSAAALQDYMAGRYQATNQRLNQILSMSQR